MKNYQKLLVTIISFWIGLEIINFLKVYKSEGSVIDSILNESSPRQAGIQLRAHYNFSNNIIKSII